MAETDNPELIYLGRSRLHRNRANLIQTLHTVAALSEIGVPTRLYLPPWHGHVTLAQRLYDMGIHSRPDIRASQLMHSRWPSGTFAHLHRRLLRSARAVYVRSHELSVSLARLGIAHHFEVHTLDSITPLQLAAITEYQRQGVIDHLIPISRSLAQALIDAGADRQRVHVSPSGVDLAAYRQVPMLDRANLAEPTLVYLGRISRDRGLATLIHLAEKVPGRVLLVGDCDDQVEETDSLQYRPAVPHCDVPKLYAESDLVLLPYQPSLGHADGISPMKMFEAMAAGRPIIASDIPPIREILRHGDNALLADPADPRAWEGAVKQLMSDRDLAVKLADRARQDVAAYSWQARARGIARAIGLMA